MIVNNIPTNGDGSGVSICPGPNIAYFDKVVSLKEMIDHIYGRIKLVNESHRPNMFVKELRLYVDYLKTKISEAPKPFTEKQLNYFDSFQKNLDEGIEYYKTLFADFETKLEMLKENIYDDLEEIRRELQELVPATA